MRTLRKVSRWAIFAIAAMLVVGQPLQATAQGGLVGETAYDVGMSGASIGWSADWEFVPKYNLVQEKYDLIGLLSQTGFQMVASLPPGTDPAAARNEFRLLFAEGATGIDNVERGEYDTVAYSLDLVDVRDSIWAVFVVSTSATGYLMTYVTYAPAEIIGVALDTAKADIEVDGLNILEGVQGAGVQDVVTAAVPNFTPDIDV